MNKPTIGAWRLSAPIVGISLTPAIGHRNWGYRLVASDGTVFNFGDAEIYGSITAPGPDSPIVAIVAPPAGLRYLLVASDGEVFGI